MPSLERWRRLSGKPGVGGGGNAKGRALRGGGVGRRGGRKGGSNKGGGGGTFVTPSAFSGTLLRRASLINYGGGAYLVAWDDEIIDSEGAWSVSNPSRIYPQTNGWIRFRGQIAYTEEAAQSGFFTTLYRQGTNESTTQPIHHITSSGVTSPYRGTIAQFTSPPIQNSSSPLIYWELRIIAGSATYDTIDADRCWFEMERLR